MCAYVGMFSIYVAGGDIVLACCSLCLALITDFLELFGFSFCSACSGTCDTGSHRSYRHLVPKSRIPAHHYHQFGVFLC